MGDIAGMDKRRELTQLLELAARAEHALCCSYLFAAFSFKRTHDEGGVTYRQLVLMRRWEGAILMVARQEMEHLGLVLNLRTAMGEALTFVMPSFPFTEYFDGLHFDYRLQAFGVPAVASFCFAEMPLHLEQDSQAYKFLERHCRDFSPGDHDLLARLYARIYTLVEQLDEDILFIGPPAVQFNTHDIFPGSIRGLDISKAPAYQVKLDKIYNRETALAAIRQIITEGEGAQLHGGGDSHFAIFFNILRELYGEMERDPGFKPARPVVPNPTVCESHDGQRTPVSYPFTRTAQALFECAYETMLMGLTRFFAFPQNDKAEMAALQQAMFFPMMTTVIRPLGEILTMLPASESGSLDTRGGPSFDRPEEVELSPHKSAAYRLLNMRYAQMEALAQELLAGVASLPPACPRKLIEERLTFLYQQVYRSRMNLKVNYEKQPDEI